jgi:hypothetical protein
MPIMPPTASGRPLVFNVERLSLNAEPPLLFGEARW